MEFSWILTNLGFGKAYQEPAFLSSLTAIVPLDPPMAIHSSLLPNLHPPFPTRPLPPSENRLRPPTRSRILFVAARRAGYSIPHPAGVNRLRKATPFRKRPTIPFVQCAAGGAPAFL